MRRPARGLRLLAPLLALAALHAPACISEDATAVTGQASTGGAAGSTDGAAGAFAEGDAEYPIYTLVLDAPEDHTTWSGPVTVSGQALGFLNVEVWDSTHKHPPLAQTTPNADGSFNVIVDTSLLPAGPATWTVFGWDSPPGYSYAHSATVTLHLTIAAPE